MKILFYGAKDYDQQFFDKLAPEFTRELLLSLLKQISMRKPLLLPRAMMESVPL